MNTQILERLRNEFAFIGDEKISGHMAMKIINEVIEELTILKEVEDAQKCSVISRFSFDEHEPEIGAYVSLVWEDGSDCECIYR